MMCPEPCRALLNLSKAASVQLAAYYSHRQDPAVDVTSKWPVQLRAA